MDLANPLDGFLLLRRGGPIEDGERIAEPVALSEDALDGRLVPEEHGIPDEVHLRTHGAGDLAGVLYPLVRLIQDPALEVQAVDGLEAHHRHGDEEERDEKERAQQLGVDGRADAGDAPDQGTQRRAGQEQAGKAFAEARPLGD